MVDAITQVPKPMVQLVNKEIPKYVLQAQERIVDVAGILNVEVPVEVPMIQTAEAITQVPVAEIQIIEKQIPKVMTEAIEKIQEVPQILIEEQLVEVPQIQTCETVRQVQNVMVQQVQKGVPRVQTQVVEKVQQVPATLICEVAIDVPQVQMVEVLRQTAAATSQRIVQTGVQYERAVGREMVLERVEAGTMAGVYEAGIVGVRENAMVQPTVVERLSPILTQEFMVQQPMVAPTTYAGVVEYAAPQVEYVTAAPTMLEYVQQPQYEYVAPAATTYMTEMVAPTTYMTEMLVAPTEYVTEQVVMEVIQ